jgi:1-phosphatidylinositol-3-phosphate 5-kinase
MTMMSELTKASLLFLLDYTKDRANEHLEAIIRRLIITSDISNKAAWTDKVLNLVRDVVSSIDPDVRCGDSLDVLSYVRLKVIPGGSIEECKYVDGIVFRQNVTHKKMLDKREAIKYNPRVLLLAGGIEFQRTDARLSSMDTLIEQEEKYLSILVEKIMYLKPDLIIVGKAVARKAQELLCEHKVAVIQNVKPELLTRIARVTGARIGSSDHMVGQYGEECLGTCRRFYIQCVTDDPERQDRNTGR